MPCTSRAASTAKRSIPSMTGGSRDGPGASVRRRTSSCRRQPQSPADTRAKTGTFCFSGSVFRVAFRSGFLGSVSSPVSCSPSSSGFRSGFLLAFLLGFLLAFLLGFRLAPSCSNSCSLSSSDSGSRLHARIPARFLETLTRRSLYEPHHRMLKGRGAHRGAPGPQEMQNVPVSVSRFQRCERRAR